MVCLTCHDKSSDKTAMLGKDTLWTDIKAFEKQ